MQVWVVDCADTRRLGDSKAEFEKLLQQERLAGSSLLVFANKQVRRNHLPPPVARADARQDLPGALSSEEVRAALRLDAIQDRHWKIQVMRGDTCHDRVLFYFRSCRESSDVWRVASDEWRMTCLAGVQRVYWRGAAGRHHVGGGRRGSARLYLRLNYACLLHSGLPHDGW